MIEQDVSHNVCPVTQCTTNMIAMPYKYVALPLQMYVAVRFDVNNSAYSIRYHPLGGLKRRDHILSG
eukprot:6458795-Prorocentrum_lima.AAC.1